MQTNAGKGIHPAVYTPLKKAVEDGLSFDEASAAVAESGFKLRKEDYEEMVARTTKASKIHSLLKLADILDYRGLRKMADEVDALIQRLSWTVTADAKFDSPLGKLMEQLEKGNHGAAFEMASLPNIQTAMMFAIRKGYKDRGDAEIKEALQITTKALEDYILKYPEKIVSRYKAKPTKEMAEKAFQALAKKIADKRAIDYFKKHPATDSMGDFEAKSPGEKVAPTPKTLQAPPAASVVERSENQNIFRKKMLSLFKKMETIFNYQTAETSKMGFNPVSYWLKSYGISEGEWQKIIAATKSGKAGNEELIGYLADIASKIRPASEKSEKTATGDSREVLFIKELISQGHLEGDATQMAEDAKSWKRKEDKRPDAKTEALVKGREAYLSLAKLVDEKSALLAELKKYEKDGNSSAAAKVKAEAEKIQNKLNEEEKKLKDSGVDVDTAKRGYQAQKNFQMFKSFRVKAYPQIEALRDEFIALGNEMKHALKDAATNKNILRYFAAVFWPLKLGLSKRNVI